MVSRALLMLLKNAASTCQRALLTPSAAGLRSCHRRDHADALDQDTVVEALKDIMAQKVSDSTLFVLTQRSLRR